MDHLLAGGFVRGRGLFHGQRRFFRRPALDRFGDPGVGPFGGRVDACHPDHRRDQDDRRADDRRAAARREGRPAPAAGAAAGEELADRAVADRLLDELPGEGRDGEDGRHLEDRPRHARPRVLAGVGEDDDRRVPQVDPVGAHADPAQRAHAQQQPQPAGRVGRRHQDQDHGEREQHEPAAVEEGVEFARLPDHDRDHEQPEPAQPIECLPRLRGDLPAQPATWPDHRQGAAEEQLESAGVGPVVDPGGVGPGLVEDRHQDHRDEAEEHGREGQARAHAAGRLALGDQLQPEQQDERPDDVELLLDRERPEVVERARRFEAREVGDVAEDLLPVVDVEHGGDDGVAELLGLGRPEDGDPGDDDHQHHEQRRQQAAGAGEPEGPELDPPDPRELREQDVGDQVAREGEEDADAEQPPGRPAEFEMEGDHRQNGYCSQPVEPGHVALVALDWFGHRERNGTDAGGCG